MKSRSGPSANSRFLVEQLSPGDFFNPDFTKAVFETLVKESKQLKDFSPILKCFLTSPIQQMAALESLTIRLKMDAHDGFKKLLEECRSLDLISDDAILKWSNGKDSLGKEEALKEIQRGIVTKIENIKTDETKILRPTDFSG